MGMVVDSNHVLIQCPAKRRAAGPYLNYHSKACYMWTLRRRLDGLGLGDTYIKWSRQKRHSPQRCQGWSVQDGAIAQCAETFTAVTTSQKHHSLACLHRTRVWRKKIGYHLGDSVRRTCAYRNCKKGDGGHRATFDRIRRAATGDYYCDQRCAAAEQRAREDDRVAKLEAQGLPKDWPTKPLPSVIIGFVLCSQDYMSNPELATRLDDHKLKCPDTYAPSWERALAGAKDGGSKRAQDYIWEIRDWVGKPARRLRKAA